LTDSSLLTDLILQLLRHDSLCVRVVEVSEVDECFPHVLVHVDGVGILHELAHHLALADMLNNFFTALSLTLRLISYSVCPRQVFSNIWEQGWLLPRIEIESYHRINV
jgi:hypothetical protein